MIRLGVVGLGVISRFYLAAIAALPDCELAAVCDPHGEALDPFRDKARCHADHREMLAGGGLDAVVVTVPNDVHLDVCRDVLHAGLPVCVEKPLATTLEDGAELAAVARDRSLTLFTAFHRRYNSNVLALREELAGAGPVESLTVRYLERIEEHVGRDRWYLDAARCGGGCVADNGPNALDLVRWLLGPLRLTGVRITRDATGIDRQAVLELHGSCPARVELDWSYPGECKDITACLADGTELRADMLGGYPGFKGSLWHEYEGVLRDFLGAVPLGARWDDAGLSALALVDQVYRVEGSQSGA
ncbi:Gfo/Idh/MocA family protein [Kutzneria albida]|uniref:Oxidoreductase domain protein n=1 Tax=Kutzneria albida DSM 43870 TaxID=1449976 RepID=W5W411_9PSEU|nr:Gfo/Idh/MocA family oxidoreductase [Kutzneria albida]AHH95181.1 oxidoreductase domain protein [Kutzneria albida DSM 43870]